MDEMRELNGEPEFFDLKEPWIHSCAYRSLGPP